MYDEFIQGEKGSERPRWPAYLLIASLVLIWTGTVLYAFLLRLIVGIVAYEAGISTVAISLFAMARRENGTLLRYLFFVTAIISGLWAAFIAAVIISNVAGIHVLATILMTSPSLST